MLYATEGGATPHALVVAIHCSPSHHRSCMSSFVLVAAVVLAAVAAVVVGIVVVGRCGHYVHGCGRLRQGRLCVVVVVVKVVVTSLSSLSLSLSLSLLCRQLGGCRRHCGGGGRCDCLRHCCLVVVGVITVAVAVQ